MRRELIQVGKTYRRGKITREVLMMREAGCLVAFVDSRGRRKEIPTGAFCRWADSIVDDPSVCRWKYDATPKESEYNYCPKCGKPIEVTK